MKLVEALAHKTSEKIKTRDGKVYSILTDKTIRVYSPTTKTWRFRKSLSVKELQQQVINAGDLL